MFSLGCNIITVPVIIKEYYMTSKFSVWLIFLFRWRFLIHLLWNRQRGLNWSNILDGSCDIAIYARHADGFRSAFMFSRWMCGIFDGRVKFRLVS